MSRGRSGGHGDVVSVGRNLNFACTVSEQRGPRIKTSADPPFFSAGHAVFISAIRRGRIYAFNLKQKRHGPPNGVVGGGVGWEEEEI